MHKWVYLICTLIGMAIGFVAGAIFSAGRGGVFLGGFAGLIVGAIIDSIFYNET